MNTHGFSRGLMAILMITAAPGAHRIVAAQANKACGLLKASEIESAIGGKVVGLKDGSTPGTGSAASATAATCTGQTPTAMIMLRVSKKTGRASGNAAEAGIAAMRKMGAKIDVKTFGPITCSTIQPPEKMRQYGFNTTCSVTKATAVAAIEVTAKTEKDMVPIEKLRPLAEKMASRF